MQGLGMGYRSHIQVQSEWSESSIGMEGSRLLVLLRFCGQITVTNCQGVFGMFASFTT